jgi:hypothetical protein
MINQNRKWGVPEKEMMFAEKLLETSLARIIGICYQSHYEKSSLL